MLPLSPEEMEENLPEMADPFPLPDIDLASTAFFFDFDGTLAAIVDDPSAVTVDQQVIEALKAIRAAAAGAVAIVSGRSIRQLDDMLRPLRLPAAGVHGLERRRADGSVSRVQVDADAMMRVRTRAEALVRRYPGLLAEEKPGSVALHYRRRPELAAACLDLAEDLAADDGRVRVLRGKMVVEIKLADRTKADAIAEFMDEPPFAGRTPLFAGDDVTDEDGFAAVERLHGISIKIGSEETRAAHRVPDIARFHDWLVRLAAASAAPTPHGAGRADGST